MLGAGPAPCKIHSVALTTLLQALPRAIVSIAGQLYIMRFFEEIKAQCRLLCIFFFLGGGGGRIKLFSSGSKEVGLGGGGCIEFTARCQKIVSIDHETFSSVRCPGNQAQP